MFDRFSLVCRHVTFLRREQHADVLLTYCLMLAFAFISPSAMPFMRCY